ncbi:serine/threonine-protein kinase [Methylobacterium sp. 285MFTsu5.1]|uniref:serine/threonine-protein kinase n=1 Tax=Methylobacterium sp. 285MFTsu5.1 TaxID=1172187 RepID=UPI00036A3437|nr:serine/threonine-protein kinase [Methylobacterium sp. 285MFTsu5.1]
MSEETIVVTAPHGRLPPGTQLNGLYEVEAFITSGGMGDIYRGRAIVTRDAVAIKTIRPDMARNEMALSLFRKEASSLHNLHHEAIVRYFVFTIDPVLGIPYLAMEFVEGEALSDIIRRGALGTGEIRVLMHRLALGLQAAHQHGIIHRDLSPDNILLPGGDVARAKIIDFGIARSPLGDGTLIGSGFAGKINYVSPEQLGLYGGEVGPRSDIYSLGLVIAAAACGKHLDMGTSHVEVLEKRRRVPEISGIDPVLRQILQRMLQSNPKDRPARMAEIADWIPLPAGGRRGRLWGIAGLATVLILAAGWGAAYLTGNLDLSTFYGARTSKSVPEPTDANDLPPKGSDSLSPPSDSERLGTTTDRRKHADPDMRGGAGPDDAPNPGNEQRDTSVPDGPPPGETVDKPTNPARAASIDQVRDFLRDYSGGRCFFIAPVTVAVNDTTIEAYGATPATFMEFDEAFQRTLGFDPEINLRQVTAAQCPIVDFLGRRSPAQRAMPQPSLTLKSDILRRGDELVARSEMRPDRPVELLLISHDGIVHNLAGYVTRAGNILNLRLRLMPAEPNADATPLLLMALASYRPLVSLHEALKGGPLTAERFARILGDEEAKGQITGVTMKYFKLTGG